MENTPKEVYFFKYCGICKHQDKNDWEEPCCECLSYPVNIDSHKPVNYEEAKK